jgi:hypothetical protein
MRFGIPGQSIAETAVPRITVAAPVTGANGVTACNACTTTMLQQSQDESGDRAMAIAADERIPGDTAAGSSQGACLLQ